MTDSTAKAVLTTEHRAVIGLAAKEIAAVFGIETRPSNEGHETFDDVVYGAFVTLKRNHQLRACYGNCGEMRRVRDAVTNAAQAVATKDYRFAAFSKRELPFLHIDISLLCNYRTLDVAPKARAKAITIGQHGVTIRGRKTSALLLPQVAPEWGWDAPQLLDQLCRKAGLDARAWRDDDLTLSTFEANILEAGFDEFLTPEAIASATSPAEPLPIEEIQNHLRRRTEQHLQEPATSDNDSGKSDVIPEWMASPIHGAAIRVKKIQSTSGIRICKLDVARTMTVGELVDFAARTILANLNQVGALHAIKSDGLDIELSLLHSPATHTLRATALRGSENDGDSGTEGSSEELDLRGFDSCQHALVLSADLNGSSDTHVWSHEPFLPWRVQARRLFDRSEALSFAHRNWFSFEVESTRHWERFNGRRLEQVSMMPPVEIEADSRWSTRPPAVAGMFYSSDPTELKAQVATHFAGASRREIDAAAIQIPHAGLAYSGRVAAATLAATRLSKSVIVISPKHRDTGANWAIAPYNVWQTIGHQFETDRELRSRLLDEIEGLELDERAHQDEHGIEVELPLLAHIAPDIQLVGITVGTADIDDCLRFGAGLARVLSTTTPRPTVIISSDMNHFANDEQTRKLDEIAIGAIETLDPSHIYHTIVEEHRISMCGVRPAVATIAALKSLDLVKRCERIAYATSGETSGNLEQVVGYAGLLFRD